MHSDIYCEKGKGHSQCEDFIVHGKADKTYFIIGSDGCSSTDGVDTGNRILTHSAKASLESYLKIIGADNTDLECLSSYIKDSVIKKSMETARILNLDVNVFDATLFILLSNGVKSFLLLWGDGAVILTYENKYKIINLEFNNNAPFYLSYHMCSNKMNNYFKNFKSPLLCKQTYSSTEGLQKNNILSDLHYREEIIHRTNDPIIAITICSDGVNTFMGTDEKIYPLTKMTKSLTGYKSYNGDFVKRRMNRIKKEHNRDGIYHYDDIFLGTLHMGT